MARKCIVCGENPAEVPDRNSVPGRPIKKICRDCHEKRISGDLRKILEQRKKNV